MLITQEITNLLNGVSQAPVEQRDPSQAEEQINALSHPTRGLRKRPPTEHRAKLSSSSTGWERAFSHALVRGSKHYFALIANGDLKVFDNDTGAEVTTLFPEGKAYLADAAAAGFRAVSVGDSIIVLNRGVTTAKDTAQKAPDVAPQALLVVRSSDYATSYTVTIDGVSSTLRLPNASSPDAAAERSTENVAVAIRDRLSITSLGNTFTFTLVGSAVHVTKLDGSDFTLTVSDGLGGDALLGIKDTVQSFELLPTRAVEGMCVKVVGAPESAADDYYVKYTEGVWREVVKPGLLLTVDAETMPHVLAYGGEILSKLEGAAAPAGPIVGTGAAATDAYGWQQTIAGAALNEATAYSTGIHGGGFVTTPTGTDGTDRTITVKYGIDCSGIVDGSISILVTLYVGGVARSSFPYFAGQILENETLGYTGPVVALDGVKLELTFSTGSTPAPADALAFLYGYNNLGPAVAVQTSAGSQLTFSPTLVYPAGMAFTVTLNGTPFNYAVGASDQTGTQVATAIAALIDADAGFIGTNPSDGIALLQTSAGATPVTAVTTSFNRAAAFFSPTAGLTGSAHVGRIVRNLSDGSEGTITANTPTTIAATLSGGADNRFDPGDLCSILGTGEYFVFSSAEWDDRAAGDDTSIPFPSFVGRALDEVFFYANRLGVTSRETIFASRAGDRFNVFRATATDLLATDPIDVKAATRSVSAYHGAVQWNDGLYLVTDGGALARLSGQPLTPQTVRLDFLSEYQNVAAVRPVGSDKNLFLASTKAGFTRIGALSRMGLSDGEDSAEVRDTTKHVATYLAGAPLAMVCEPNAEMLFVLTDGGARRSLYVCHYGFSRDGEAQQLAWSRWDFSMGSVLVGLDVLNGVVSLVFKRADGAYLESLTLDPAQVLSLLIGDGTASGDGEYNGSGLLV